MSFLQLGLKESTKSPVDCAPATYHEPHHCVTARPYFANRTTAFTTCAALNCGEPVPFIDGPMRFHYEAPVFEEVGKVEGPWT